MTLPSDPASQLAMQGKKAMRAGMYDRALQCFARALDHEPDSDALHYHYASACAWRGRPNDALAALDRCMALHGPWHDHAARLAQEIRAQMGQAAAAAEPSGETREIGWDKGSLAAVGATAIGDAIGMPDAADDIADEIESGTGDVLD